MNRRVAISMLALLALSGLLGWLVRVHLIQAKAHERAVLSRSAPPRKVLPLPPIDPPKPVTPAEYAEVAQRALFFQDRNPNVIVELKPPPPKPPLPPLPFYFGQAALGEPAIFLSTGGSTQKPYHAGDKIGDKEQFVIVSFDQNKITLGFHDETVEKNLEDLRPKQETPAQQAPVAAAPARPATARTGSLSSASVGDDSPDKKDSVIGADYGSGYRACVPGDTTPAGTVKDGYRKVMTQTMFGQSCHWETVK